MNTRCIFPLLAISVCAGHAVSGQQEQSWAQEPTSFRGIEFGKPLSASIRECPRKQYTRTFSAVDSSAANGMCWEHIGNGSAYHIYNVDKFFSFTVKQVDGVVVAVSGSTRGIWINQIGDALIERFGQPQKRVDGQVQSGSGASFPSTTMTWFGRALYMSYSTTSDRVDESWLLVETLAERSSDLKAREEAAKGLAASF